MIRPRIWSLRLWPFTFHLALTRTDTGASLTVGVFVWKLAIHAAIAAFD